MPSWWRKSSSKESKKSTKENFLDTWHRIISTADSKENTRSRGTHRRGRDVAVVNSSRSTAQSRSTSPSSLVARCQSFADRPQAHPLPPPVVRAGVTRTASDVTVPKPILEKRGKPQLTLPLPRPNTNFKRSDPSEITGVTSAASFSSNGSIDSVDLGDSQLHSPIQNDAENGSRVFRKNHPSVKHKELPATIAPNNRKEIAKPMHAFNTKQNLSTSPKFGPVDNHQSPVQTSRHGTLESAPDSLMSSPSRSPIRICPDLIPSSAFLAVKPHSDVTFLGSGQCSSPGSGQTSGHNSVGGDMLGQFLWQPSRSSPECSPIPSPRISPGPSSRVHSGSVSPLHPRAAGISPESPTNRTEEGKKKHSHKLPLPPANICSSSYGPTMSTPNSPRSVPRSPGRAENLLSPVPRWKKGRLIGRGTFGHVYVGFNSENGEMCAMKEVTLFLDDPKSKECAIQLRHEISFLRRLRHPNIVQYYGSEMIDDKLYIYLEYVSGGSIHKLLQEYGQFGETAIRNYTQQILSGLAYLHAKNTVHRDVKGANILVDPNGRVVKLADFGMAKHINGPSCPFSLKGSPYWMAPEVIKNASGCNLAVDIWSLGCTVLEMATSKPPWSQYEGIAAMFKIGNSKELPAIPDHLSDEGKDFIKLCLQREPSKRPTALELLQHPFVRHAASLEKSASTDPLGHIGGISFGTSAKGVRRMEGQSLHQRRGARISAINSAVHIRTNVSCPVSPCGSPLLKSRSPQNANGWTSPSPISSPRTTSGASTPLTGGNGAIPFNQLKQSSHGSESFSAASKAADDFFSSRLPDPLIGRAHRGQQGLPVLHERIISEADVSSCQHGKPSHGNILDRYEMQSPSERALNKVFGDQMKLTPLLDLTETSQNVGHLR